MSTLLSAGHLPPNRHDDLDNYTIDDLDDPFASPSPPSSAKKRKEPPSQGLGIDKEVSVQKRARAPRVKLDEERLLSPAGLPKLRHRARDLKLKGKGHEFSDAARLLSFYQLWLDDLFPKAKFLDALAMVEKAGHKKRVMTARNELMNEGRPKAWNGDEDADADPTQDLEYDATNTTSIARDAPERDAVRSDRPATPVRQKDVPDEEDLYDATPRITSRHEHGAVLDDEDDLDALIAEAEGQDGAAQPVMSRIAPWRVRPDGADEEGEEEDLDALVAQVEARQGNVKPRQGAQHDDGTKTNEDFAEEEAAMQEMDGLW